MFVGSMGQWMRRNAKKLWHTASQHATNVTIKLYYRTSMKHFQVPLDSLLLSVVIPCYNEQDCLEELHRRVTAVCRAAAEADYEIVLVNDGSRDATWPRMSTLCRRDPKLVAVNLSRNHGHQLALS